MAKKEWTSKDPLLKYLGHFAHPDVLAAGHNTWGDWFGGGGGDGGGGAPEPTGWNTPDTTNSLVPSENDPSATPMDTGNTADTIAPDHALEQESIKQVEKNQGPKAPAQKPGGTPAAQYEEMRPPELPESAPALFGYLAGHTFEGVKLR